MIVSNNIRKEFTLKFIFFFIFLYKYYNIFIEKLRIYHLKI